MDPNDPNSRQRKLKFRPISRRQRNPQPPPNPNPNPNSYVDNNEQPRARNNIGRSEPQVERNSSVQGSGKSSGSDSKEYKEPWDYVNSCYPTTLPLRKQPAGDPEILDKEEFGDAATNVMYEKPTINPAKELGLSEKSKQPRMLLFQLPRLPFVKQPPTKKGKEKVGSSSISGESTKVGPWDDLPGGFMGKMLVYKSGAIKLKLGEVLFNVSPGTQTMMAQDVVAINTAQKHCCVIRPLREMAVMTPDLDSFEL